MSYIRMEHEHAVELLNRVMKRVESVIIGKKTEIRYVLTAMLSGGMYFWKMCRVPGKRCWFVPLLLHWTAPWAGFNSRPMSCKQMLRALQSIIHIQLNSSFGPDPSCPTLSWLMK